VIDRILAVIWIARSTVTFATYVSGLGAEGMATAPSPLT